MKRYCIAVQSGSKSTISSNMSAFVKQYLCPTVREIKSTHKRYNAKRPRPELIVVLSDFRPKVLYLILYSWICLKKKELSRKAVGFAMAVIAFFPGAINR